MKKETVSKTIRLALYCCPVIRFLRPINWKLDPDNYREAFDIRLSILDPDKYREVLNIGPHAGVRIQCPGLTPNAECPNPISNSQRPMSTGIGYTFNPRHNQSGILHNNYTLFLLFSDGVGKTRKRKVA